MTMEDLLELLNCLTTQTRTDVRLIGLDNILALTGNDENLDSIIQIPDFLNFMITLLHDAHPQIAKAAALVLVNISAKESGAIALLKSSQQHSESANVVRVALKHIVDSNSVIADMCCMILSNMTRLMHCTDSIIDIIDGCKVSLDEIINVFTKNKYNKNATLQYLGPVLSNLSQSSRVRKYILDRDKCVIQRLLPFTEYSDSVVKRGGVVGTLRNSCFETDYHHWLLSEEVDILPRLLLPLAGNTEYDEDDNDKLPPELQYLPEHKKREEDPDIRCMLLEAITQLCAIKKNREFIRDKNTYVILRELHKWEKDRKALIACENLVDILIRTEDEIGHENLKDVEVPSELVENFTKFDGNILQE